MDHFCRPDVFEILNYITLPSGTGRPEEVLAAKLDQGFQTDRGVSVVEITGNVPRCIIWPDYSDYLIKDFNSHYCYTAPYVYNKNQQTIFPVSWSDYGDIEYNRDFIEPLKIGYTIGLGVFDEKSDKEIVFCIHKSNEAEPFSNKDLKILKQIHPIIQNMFQRYKHLHSSSMNKLLPREISPGCRALSFREREILDYLVDRDSMKDIAIKLGISRRTVETHALHIYQKLCIASRSDLQRFIVAPVEYSY